jgi:hypothetical protein
VYRFLLLRRQNLFGFFLPSDSALHNTLAHALSIHLLLFIHSHEVVTDPQSLIECGHFFCKCVKPLIAVTRSACAFSL